MNFFPSKKYQFKLIGKKEDTLDRLNRRTEKSKYLISQWTEKSFRGQISENEFRIISSTIGKGAFCVMSGRIDSENGFVKIEINKAFKVLLSFIYLFPFLGIFMLLYIAKEEFNLIMVISVIGQILMIRFIGIWFFFKRFSKHSLNQLRDVLDIEWIKH